MQHRGKLPAEIDAVADAEIHAIAAERRMQMAGIAGEKHAVVAVMIGDQAMRRPVIARYDLGRERPADGGMNAVDHFVVADCGDAGREPRDEGPFAVAVERAQDARAFPVDQPIHNGPARRRRSVEFGNAQDQIVIERKGMLAGHLGADNVADAALRAVGADQILRANGPPRVGFEIANSGDHAEGRLRRRLERGARLKVY